MAQTIFPVTPTEITAGSANAWVDMDASALAPSGATGLAIHVVEKANTSAYLGVRKKGSTDDRKSFIQGSHSWLMVGVDGSRVFQVYVGSTTDIDIWVVGYTMSGVTFLTNGADKSLGTTSAWTDIDCSAQAPSAIGFIFETLGSATYAQFGFRKNGGTDNVYGYSRYRYNFGAIIGCDGSQICEGYTTRTDYDFYLLGYITSGATFHTNFVDLSLGTTGTWIDLTTLPASSMAFIEIYSASSSLDYGLREDGSAEDIYTDSRYIHWGIIKCSAAYKIEGKIASLVVKFYRVGYAEAAAAGISIPVAMHHYNQMWRN